MALSGIEIYKYLPKTNCKKCNFPTCLAFAMKVAARTVDISACPDISAQSRAALESAGRPPIRLVKFGPDSHKIEVGNETAMFRHEKTFYHPPALVVRLKDTMVQGDLDKLISEVNGYEVERVGMKLTMDGFAIQNDSKDPGKFAGCAEYVASKSTLGLMLLTEDPVAMEAAASKVASKKPLLHGANAANLDAMIGVAKKCGCPLVVKETSGLEQLAALSEKVAAAGIEDIVLDPGVNDFKKSIDMLTNLRRQALKKNLRPLGYPIVSFPGETAANVDEEAMLAAQHIAKYAGIIVLDHFSGAVAYTLLTMRLNIYTDPQKPIQMAAGVYEIGAPKKESPLCVTTNFSLTYFSVAGEIEASGIPTWLLICDTEGLSVLTAWAAGKFDSERIAKAVKAFNVGEKISHKTLVLPGKVAVLRGELEDELPGWKVLVGPPEAMDLGAFFKRSWTA
ncbi:MAG: acetyl-CoA decarbonylase/synthase complex subunit gamma [Chloroflexi bacterium]|nr:acetyl-CoA decarbonylase/synthase complex subunit gamma [Chloroflexota bacterium]